MWEILKAKHNIMVGYLSVKLKNIQKREWEKRQQNENKHKFQFNGILLESVSQQAVAAAQDFFISSQLFFCTHSSYPWKMHHNFSNLFSTIYVLLRQMESNDLPFESWSCNTWDQLFLLPMLLQLLYITPHDEYEERNDVVWNDGEDGSNGCGALSVFLGWLRIFELSY